MLPCLALISQHTLHQHLLGHGGGMVGGVVHERSDVLLLRPGGPHVDALHSVSNLTQHSQQLVAPYGGRQIAETQLPLLRAPPDTKPDTTLEWIQVQSLDSSGCASRVSVFGISKASVLPTEVHHEAELVERGHALEQWDQLVLVHVPWDLTYKDLTAWTWCWTSPS